MNDSGFCIRNIESECHSLTYEKLSILNEIAKIRLTKEYNRIITFFNISFKSRFVVKLHCRFIFK